MSITKLEYQSMYKFMHAVKLQPNKSVPDIQCMVQGSPVLMYGCCTDYRMTISRFGDKMNKWITKNYSPNKNTKVNGGSSRRGLPKSPTQSKLDT